MSSAFRPFHYLGDNALLKAARTALTVDTSLFAATSASGHGHSPTVNITKLTSGDNCHSVPDRTVLGMDIRSTTEWPHVHILEQVQTAMEEFRAHKGGMLARMPPLWNEPHTPWLNRVFNLKHSYTGVRPTEMCRLWWPVSTSTTEKPAWGQVDRIYVLCYQFFILFNHTLLYL
ncbi:MAG: peptidase dimerization domain-containing protein [Desulfoplanes sp.]